MKRSRMQGLTLVELMVAMVLGMVVIGGAISLTLANRQSYRTNEGLSQMQESARTAFELIGRDVRQAGVLGCDNSVARVANNLNDQTVWWRSWFGLRGFTGTQASSINIGTANDERATGTDALQLQGIQGLSLFVNSHDAANYSIVLNATATTANVTAGDIFIACDFDHSTLFQATAYDASTFTIRHDQRASPQIGNCSRGLDFPNDCASTTGNSYAFPRNAQIGRFFATEWYIGRTGRAEDGGLALYRSRVGAAGQLFTEEVVSGVVGMQIAYRVAGTDSFVAANTLSAAQWANVNAIQLDLRVVSADTRVSTNLTTNAGRLQKDFRQIITLRNRVP